MPFQEKRLVNPTVLTTSASSALYTVPTGYTAIIKQLVVTNTTASPRTFTIYIGATAVAGNALFSGTAIAASDALVINLSQVLASTEKIFALSDAGSALNLTISGVENNGPLEAVATYIADNAVTTAKIADASVTTEKIAAGAIIDVDVNASAAIAPTKIAGTSVVKTDYTAKGVALIGSGVSTPTALTVGTNGQLLTANSATTTGLEWQNNTSGLVFVKSQTFSNVAAVQINDCFNVTYDHYKVLLNLYGSQSGTATYARYRFVAGTTPSSAGYFGKSIWTDINANNFSFVNSDATTDAGSLGPLGFVGAGEGSYDMEIHYPNVARPTRAQISGQGLYQNAYYTGTTGWTLQTGNTSFQGLYIYAMNFNITGDITIYGYRKA